MYTLFILFVFFSMLAAFAKAIWDSISKQIDDLERREFGETLREKEGASAVVGNV